MVRWKTLWLLGTLALLAASPSFAQKKTPQKGGRLLNSAAQAEADRAAAEANEAARKAREDRSPTVVKEKEREKVEVVERPTLVAEDFRDKIEFQVAEKRKELIAYLDRILNQGPPDEERPELLFQKAELFQEEAQFQFFQGMELDDDIAVADFDKKKRKVKKLKKQQKKKLDESRKWIRDAVLLYQEIDENYPQYERMPDVLYSLGRAFWGANSYRNALPVYRKLIKNHPKSQYVADSWLAFGEYYFELAEEKDRDLNKALDAYKKAAQYQDNPIFGYAVYKQGWCYYNLTRYDKSAEKFKEVVLYSDLNADLLGEKRITLAKEARKDFILAYAQYGRANKASSEFDSITDSKDELKKMLERLGDIWYGDGKDREAIRIYRELKKMDPENTRNPLYQGKIVKLASRIGAKNQVVKHARVLVEDYKRVRDLYASLDDKNEKREKIKEDLAAADEISDNTLRALATTWHNEAKKTRDDKTFEYAYELYGDYLDLFPERKPAYEIRFFYAELLYRLERFQKAGEQYVRVYKQDPEGKWAEASAEEAVRAFDEVVQDYNRTHKMKQTAGLKPIPLPPIKKAYVGACNNYVKNFPKGKIVLEAKYKVARTLYDHNYFDESTPRFMEIVEQHSGTNRADQSANLVLDTYNILEDWQRLHDAARQFRTDRKLMKNDEFKDLVAKVLEEASFKLIGNYEEKKQWVEAATRYLAFSDEFKKSALADKAMANAAAMFTRAGQLDRAIKVRERLVKRFPESPLVPDQMFAIASSYEQVVSYRQAANYLEKFVEKHPKDPRAKDALYNASIYRQGVGQTREAVEDREKYLKAYPKAKDAEDIAFSIPVTWEQAKKKSQAIDAYVAFARSWERRAPAKALEAQYRAVKLLENDRRKKKEFAKELKTLSRMARDYKKSGKSVSDAADPLGYLAFRDAMRVYESFTDMKIASANDLKKFKKTFESKQKGVQKVYATFTDVVKIGSPIYAVASLYQIGLAYGHLAKAIQEVPPPGGLNAEQELLFREKLSEKTLPMEDQAANAMTLCLDESARVSVFNKWTRKCLSYLERVRPRQFPKNEKEIRPALVVEHKRREQGHGVVVELPKKGDRPKTAKGTEPPVPPRAKKRVSMAFEGDELEKGGDS